MKAHLNSDAPLPTVGSQAEKMNVTHRLQSKALNRWEKQQEAWHQMAISLARRTGRRPNGTTNFTSSTAQMRAQIEDFGMIQSAVPQAELSNYYAWEALLRCTDATKATRYVQIGKAYYPYAIFGEVQDTSALKPNHPSYSRILSGPPVETAGARKRAEAREVLRRRVDLGDDKEATDKFNLDEQDLSRRKDNYYRSQILKFSSHIQKKFAHFLVPRQFLQLEGTTTPRMTKEEHAAVEEKEKARPPEATVFYPAPQNVRLPVKVAPEPTGRAQEDFSVTLASTSQQKAIEVQDEAATSPRSVPSIVLSTRRLLFRGYPGELVHGHVRLRNTSAVTVYYSWMPVDLIHEGLQAKEMTEHSSGVINTKVDGDVSVSQGADSSSGGVSGSRRNLSPVERSISMSMLGNSESNLQQSRQLHTMATRTRRAQSYFRLSTPLNGVVLPEETEVFPFSMRSPHEGCFKRTYELLTIPPGSERILIELCAIVSSSSPTAEMLASPIERVLAEKVKVDAQRQLVQRLLSNEEPYEQSDIRQEMERMRKKKLEEENADRVRREKEKTQWTEHNQHMFDNIPYHPLVYAKLSQLHGNLVKAMRRLRCPLHHELWEGSVAFLVNDVGRLRDSALRAELVSGCATLLRLARVVTSEDETLEQLMRRAAKEMCAQHKKSAEEVLQTEVEFAQYPREPVNAMPAKPKRGASASGKKQHPGGNGGKEPGSSSRDNAYVVTGPFRSPPMMVEHEEQELRLAEYDLLLEDQMKALNARCEELEKAMYHQILSSVERACDLPLLEVVQSCREEDIAKIQHIEEMEVDTGADSVPMKLGGKAKK